MRPSASSTTCLALALATLIWVSPSHALERQFRLGVDATGATLSAPSGNATGFGGGAHLAYGVNDWLNLELMLAGTHHGSAGATVTSATGAAMYAVDVIEWVPYFGIFAGGYHFFGTTPSTSFGAGLALGLDYQFDPSFSVGAQLRLHEVFAPDPYGATTYGTFGLRAEYVWGF